MMKIYYGLTSRAQAVDIAIAVCNALGNGANDNADLQMLEICAQESHLGLYIDRTEYSAGSGLSQIDERTFEDIRDRTRAHNKEIVFKTWGINVDLVGYVELAHSPLLALIFCRLFLKLFESEIPVELKDRALWWKSYYNTILGHGTVDQYIINAQKQGVQALLTQRKEQVR